MGYDGILYLLRNNETFCPNCEELRSIWLQHNLYKVIEIKAVEWKDRSPLIQALGEKGCPQYQILNDDKVPGVEVKEHNKNRYLSSVYDISVWWNKKYGTPVRASKD